MQNSVNKKICVREDRSLIINELVDIVINVVGKNILKKYYLSKPQGVRGRNADLILMKEVLDWEP